MKYFAHLKKYILSGSLAVVPIMLVYFVLRFLYLTVDSTVLNLIDNYLGFRIPGTGILLVLLILYFLGLFVSNIVGRWFFGKIEWFTQKIPLVRTTYQVGKQISNSLTLPGKQVFKKVVLVNYLTADIYTIGFITGSLTEEDSGRKLLKVFIPTPPNPMSGTMVLVSEDQVLDPGWTIDEGIRTVISAGIIGPDHIKGKPIMDKAKALNP